MRSELAEHAPNDWRCRPIEDVCIRVTSGGTPSRRNGDFYNNGRWPWVKTQELRDCWLDDTEEHITDEAISRSSAKVLPERTILLALYGATVGQLGILRRPMTCNQACCAMIVDPTEANFRFLYYSLIASRRQLKSLASGAAQQNLSGKLIREFILPFPDIAMQEYIAHILGTLDDKIELNRRMNRTLERIAAAIFKSWFIDFDPVHAKAACLPAGRKAAPSAHPGAWFVYALECEDGSIYVGHTDDVLRRFDEHCSGKGAQWTRAHSPKRIAYWEELSSQEAAVTREKKLKTGAGREWLKEEIAKRDLLPETLPKEIADLFPDSFQESELGSIPMGWTVAPMKDLVDVNARSINKDYPHKRIRYVDISSVSQGSLNQTTTYDLADAPSRAKRLVQTGDTIWSCVRPNRKAYLYIDQPANNLVVSTGFAVLSPRVVPPSYLHQWVTTQGFVEYLSAYATGAAYPAVKGNTFETAKMILPSEKVLKAFHNIVGPLRARIAHNQRQNRRLAGLRDVLLPKLLSGEIDVSTLEGLAEEVGP